VDPVDPRRASAVAEDPASAAPDAAVPDLEAEFAASEDAAAWTPKDCVNSANECKPPARRSAIAAVEDSHSCAAC
jgi:hypothetical protein